MGRRKLALAVAMAMLAAVSVAFYTVSAGARMLAAADLSFRGDGGKTLAPFRVVRPSTLFWVASGGVFQIFNDGMSSGGSVNSQASRGATYMPARRYTLTVNAIGSWVIKIVPGIERPQRIRPGFIGFRGNGGRELPPFSTRRGTTLYWQASGGIFQLFSDGLNGPVVNSQGSRGSTYMASGRHTVIVNALGAWVIYWRP